MTKDSRRLPLASWQIEDAANLKRLYQQKRGPLNLTQEKIAAELGEGVTQGAVSHFLNGRTGLSLKAASVFARMLGVPVSEFSTRLSKQLEAMTFVIPASDYGKLGDDADSPVEAATAQDASTPLPSGRDPSGTVDDHYAFIPYLSAKAAAGSGYENPYVEARSTLAFKREWLKHRGAAEKYLVAISADGDSMWPTINSGDVLLIDKSKVDPDHQQIFVLRNSDGIIVKRLVKGPLGNWVIRSDNEDKDEFPDRALLRKDEDEHRIIGRVIWRGGDL